MRIKTYNHHLQRGADHPYLSKLKSLGLLHAGALIPREKVEFILGCKYAKDDWGFLGKYLQLKEQIEVNGFFITQADLEPPEFRIISTEEMAEHATKKLAKAMASNYKVSYIMAAHNTSSLDEVERKRYDSVRKKAASIAMAQQKILLDDFDLS